MQIEIKSHYNSLVLHFDVVQDRIKIVKIQDSLPKYLAGHFCVPYIILLNFQHEVKNRLLLNCEVTCYFTCLFHMFCVYFVYFKILFKSIIL